MSTVNARVLLLAAALGVLGAAPAAAEARAPAFPGAVGFGRFASGWRGGEVVHVTSLDDRGPGSLRACAENGWTPRVCVFDVGGTILLSEPIMAGSNLYIAGQTAPGQGIQLRHGTGTRTPLVLRNVRSTLVRFLKIRPGANGDKGNGNDAVTVESSRDIYLDHLSLAFASDETFNVHVNRKPARDITLANSILALSLNRANHPDGAHSKGALICSDETDGIPVDCGRITLAGNLFAHHLDRMPDVKGTAVGPVEIVNNVFFNGALQFGEFYDTLGPLSVAYVGNVVRPGPDTSAAVVAAVEVFEWTDAGDVALYAADNRVDGHCGAPAAAELPLLDSAAARAEIAEPAVALRVSPRSPDRALTAVLRDAGARTRAWGGADPLDARVLADVAGCGGRIIDSPDEVGGWPELPAAVAAPDRDRDGMPDAWEAPRAGLRADDADDAWADRDGDGQANLEEYLEAATDD